jgi:hypothetical protein
VAKDWKKLPDGKEKYAAYLCSREWSVLKEAVHKRAGGICERCHVFAIDAVHHTTYARKYHEELEDLQGNCKHCHDFTHAKSQRDPDADKYWILYVRECKRLAKQPVSMLVSEGYCIMPPFGVIDHCVTQAAILEEMARRNFDADDGQDIYSAAEQYREIAWLIQEQFLEVGYLIWIQMERPRPRHWGETWEDVA